MAISKGKKKKKEKKLKIWLFWRVFFSQKILYMNGTRFVSIAKW
jgi:hypothetical protein